MNLLHAGDAVAGLNIAQEQPAFGQQVIRESVEERLPKGPVQIVEHIAKKDDLEPGCNRIASVEKVEVSILYL
jgi:hypothetical protein